MNEYIIKEDISTQVGDAFWKSSFRAGVAAAWGVMNALCIMRRPQGL
jgi:hypothetical protein